MVLDRPWLVVKLLDFDPTKLISFVDTETVTLRVPGAVMTQWLDYKRGFESH